MHKSNLRAFAYRLYKRENDDTRDCAAIVRITCAAFLGTLALSWRLYIRDLRIFQVTPAIEIFDKIPPSADWAFLVTQIVLLSWLFVKPLQRAPAFGVLTCMVFGVLQDLMRLQPYYYMYFFTILLTVIFRSSGLSALRILVGSVYFWGGFHKFNMSFYRWVFPSFISSFYTFSAKLSVMDFFMALVVFAVPALESAIGILLLFFPRLRWLASLMALAMLAVVLACLGPFGLNRDQVVLPWNVYLFLIELILFCKSVRSEKKPLWQLNALGYASVALFAFAPALALVGWWPSYPAFKLVSGNIKTAAVIFSPQEDLARLPEDLGKFVSSQHVLTLYDWTRQEINAVVTPDSYVFHRGSKGLCPYLNDPQNAKLRIYTPPPFYSLKIEYEDFPLCSEN